jgi:hypothetical protein
MPDAPIDVPALPPDSGLPADMALPADAALPPDTAAPPNGCASGFRKAFTDTLIFPNIAGCGSAPVTYGDALGSAASVCAPGWHWCRPPELRDYPASPPPSQVSGTCSWLDSTSANCNDKRTTYNRAGCQAPGAQTLSAGGPTAGTCTLVDLMCTASAWKYAVQLQSWAASSMTDPGGCINHVGFSCGGTIGNATCWITCCKN